MYCIFSVCVCILALVIWHENRMTLLYRYLSGSTVFFPHYLINGTILWGKNLLKMKYMFSFSLQLFSETFLITRRVQPDIITNYHGYSCKVPVILVRFQFSLNFLDRFSKNSQISDLIKIRPVRANLFDADRQTYRQTDRHGKANSHFPKIYERTKKPPVPK
jgi:hypothetical protein